MISFKLEGTKIDAAQTNIDLFQKETEARIKLLEQARSLLHESFNRSRSRKPNTASSWPRSETSPTRKAMPPMPRPT